MDLQTNCHNNNSLKTNKQLNTSQAINDWIDETLKFILKRNQHYDVNNKTITTLSRQLAFVKLDLATLTNDQRNINQISFILSVVAKSNLNELYLNLFAKVNQTILNFITDIIALTESQPNQLTATINVNLIKKIFDIIQPTSHLPLNNKHVVCLQVAKTYAVILKRVPRLLHEFNSRTNVTIVYSSGESSNNRYYLSQIITLYDNLFIKWWNVLFEQSNIYNKFDLTITVLNIYLVIFNANKYTLNSEQWIANLNNKLQAVFQHFIKSLKNDTNDDNASLQHCNTKDLSVMSCNAENYNNTAISKLFKAITCIANIVRLTYTKCKDVMHHVKCITEVNRFLSSLPLCCIVKTQHTDLFTCLFACNMCLNVQTNVKLALSHLISTYGEVYSLTYDYLMHSRFCQGDNVHEFYQNLTKYVFHKLNINAIQQSAIDCTDQCLKQDIYILTRLFIVSNTIIADSQYSQTIMKYVQKHTCIQLKHTKCTVCHCLLFLLILNNSVDETDPALLIKYHNTVSWACRMLIQKRTTICFWRRVIRILPSKSILTFSQVYTTIQSSSIDSNYILALTEEEQFYLFTAGQLLSIANLCINKLRRNLLNSDAVNNLFKCFCRSLIYACFQNCNIGRAEKTNKTERINNEELLLEFSDNSVIINECLVHIDSQQKPFINNNSLRHKLAYNMQLSSCQSYLSCDTVEFSKQCLVDFVELGIISRLEAKSLTVSKVHDIKSIVHLIEKAFSVARDILPLITTDTQSSLLVVLFLNTVLNMFYSDSSPARFIRYFKMVIDITIEYSQILLFNSCVAQNLIQLLISCAEKTSCIGDCQIKSIHQEATKMAHNLLASFKTTLIHTGYPHELANKLVAKLEILN